ncbi:MAG: ABC transporter permease, partial [Candidatus Latescibacterota bacterium]
RCFLTMSGITWGTMSVILLLAFGESFRDAAMKSMSGMGSNIIIMGGGRTTLPYSGMPPGRYIRLREDSATLIQNNIPEIGELSPEIERYIQMSAGTKKQSNQCVGVYPVYGVMRNLTPEKGGRFIDRLDMENRRRVIFIGTQIREKFYGKENDPVGKTLMVNGIPFTVIGVMQEKTQNSSYMTRDANIAFIPFTTCREVFGVTYLARIICRARSVVETPVLKEKTYALLGRRIGFSSDDKDALWMWDTSEMTQFMHYFFLGFETFLLLGGIFTLIVGGIGVANIMYVTVRERRREIGIKSALGATPRLILAQFMLESFLIMFLGGGLGVVMAWLVVTLFGMPVLSGARTFLGTPSINLPIALITATLLAMIGFAAGWSPAKAASDMDPVRALEF